MKALTIPETREMLLAAADAIIAQVDYLTEVDSAIGDGDHGIGMSGGMEKAKEALGKLESPPDINTLFKSMGMAMLNSMGGASGVIFGTLFIGAVKGLESKTELDCGTFADMQRRALNAIKERGKAQVGDKTMVDALEPAVEAMEKAAPGEDLGQMLEEAAQAARQGMENTKAYVAKFGRAKSLMERAVGHQDAGATSVSIIFDAMRDYVKQS